METEVAFETLAFDSTFPRLIARKHFITFMRSEIIKFHIPRDYFHILDSFLKPSSC
jgi:hypothetical protein